MDDSPAKYEFLTNLRDSEVDQKIYTQKSVSKKQTVRPATRPIYDRGGPQADT